MEYLCFLVKRIYFACVYFQSNFKIRNTPVILYGTFDFGLVRKPLSIPAAELPRSDLHSLFLQYHPQRRFVINIFYLKSSHRLK